MSAAKPAARSAGKAAAGFAKKLEKLGLRTRFDLILHLPLRYEDETALTHVANAPPGVPVLVEATVARVEIAYRPRRQLVVHVLDDDAPLSLRFFNFYPSQIKPLERAIEDGLRVRAFGDVRIGRMGAEMTHPRYRVITADEPLADALTPVYPTTAGVSQAALRSAVLDALGKEALSDSLPRELRERNSLQDFGAAVRFLHLPPPGVDCAALMERTHPAWRRIKFDELLAQQLSMRMHYLARRSRAAPALSTQGPLLAKFIDALPFRLTGAQQRCLVEINRDIVQTHPMQRLLQGDVGSGKTILAALAALAAVDSGWQAAVMAPTEILAEQHYRKFSEWLAPLGVPIVWLHGGLAKKDKRAALAALASDATGIAIGTHALFQEGVDFPRLGLAIVDEQHRFGVQQRLALRRKAGADGAVPHQLMMSATPIPRTLSMSYYADLDVSVVDELPPGRKPVKTRLIAIARRSDVLARIRSACAEGQQAYWVCPLIEAGERGGPGPHVETLELQTALDAHAELTAEFSELTVGLLHGRMPSADKASAMLAFKEGRMHLLVCTTVIEVGVDVPNASLMVIEHAERFGLAQLHQLRGRVGRGSRESDCILLYANPLSQMARSRLKVIYEKADGFEVANADLHLRGPGEYLGERQSGAPLLRFADLEKDEAMIAVARDSAAWLLEHHPADARAHVERWLGSRQDFAKV